MANLSGCSEEDPRRGKNPVARHQGQSRKYSVLRQDGAFHYIHSTSFGNYSFICVDATPSPGPKRPYNFFGILNENQMAELSALATESHRSNQTVWFGHYPTSTIISPSPGIRTIMRSATAYLCGHLHTLGGLMPVLHSQHSQGTLELELGDWMDNRRYRLFAFDHDLFSFADLVFDRWPVVLVTNPKSFLYSSSAHEPLQRIRYSTHIRLLAFSPSPVTAVAVRVDGRYLGNAVGVSGPLFVLKWDPRNYSQGSHHIEVTVQDSTGRSSTVRHVFSLQEDTPLRFGFLPSFILLTDHYVVARIIFGLLLVAQLALLLIFRFLRKPVLKGSPGSVALTSFSLHVLSKTNTFFYPVLLLNLYTAFGPWFVGEIIDGQIGACFSFGVFVGGHFLQGGMTFVVGILQLALFNVPLGAYLCWSLAQRCGGHSWRSHMSAGRRLRAGLAHLAALGLLAGQAYSCLALYLAYGPLAALCSPMRLWLLMLAPALVRRAWTLAPSQLLKSP
ncbi:transmembrane protein 62 isoform X3 [Tachyglossus aculeatus]|uniref:transmembrane protein 62 isoform X3 n=1 Tax=Tachyglossus aculeatus TaxID=9261 RepID=UPI0018F55089|nr:transmembrane protein 62 isoform X3 [Tachyglossus aculeatus]